MKEFERTIYVVPQAGDVRAACAGMSFTNSFVSDDGSVWEFTWTALPIDEEVIARVIAGDPATFPLRVSVKKRAGEKRDEKHA